MSAGTAIVYRQSARARRYRLALGRDGVAVATIPIRGSRAAAERFVAEQGAWLERALARHRGRPRSPEAWQVGSALLWRGELCELRVARSGPSPQVCLAADVFTVPALQGDLRFGLEPHFIRRARVELPGRTWEWAARVGSELKRVDVRNQRSRWGSCSVRGVVSLNWRLIRTPDLVIDYIICHELMHLRQMNHSDRFWALVQEVYPAWRSAEAWIKANAGLVGL